MEGALPTEALDAQRDLAGGVRGPMEEVGQLPPDHVPDQRHLGDLGHRLGRDVLTVAEDRDLIAELEDLVESVADEQDRHPGRGESPNLTEQALHLVGRQRRRGLVHDEDPDVARHRLGDLHRLLRADRQLRRQRAWIDLDLELAQDGVRPLVHVAPAHQPAAAGLVHEDVLRHGEVREHQGLLVDAGDAQRLRIGRAAQLDLLAVHQQLAGVRAVEAGHHLDQGRLAGAVLAHQRVDLTRVEIERDAAERVRRAEALRHVRHGQQRLRTRRRAACCASGTSPPNTPMSTGVGRPLH